MKRKKKYPTFPGFWFFVCFSKCCLDKQPGEKENEGGGGEVPLQFSVLINMMLMQKSSGNHLCSQCSACFVGP